MKRSPLTICLGRIEGTNEVAYFRLANLDIQSTQTSREGEQRHLRESPKTTLLTRNVSASATNFISRDVGIKAQPRAPQFPEFPRSFGRKNKKDMKIIGSAPFNIPKTSTQLAQGKVESPENQNSFVLSPPVRPKAQSEGGPSASEWAVEEEAHFGLEEAHFGLEAALKDEEKGKTSREEVVPPGIIVAESTADQRQPERPKADREKEEGAVQEEHRDDLSVLQTSDERVDRNKGQETSHKQGIESRARGKESKNANPSDELDIPPPATVEKAKATVGLGGFISDDPEEQKVVRDLLEKYTTYFG